MQSGYDEFVRAETTRRALLRRAGAVVFTLGAGSPLLAACGASTSPSTGTSGGKATVGGDVDFMSWEGYDLPNEMKAWNAAHDVRFRSTYIGTYDDIQAKLKSGGAANYDQISYYQGAIDLYRKLDIVSEIDESKLPNLKGVDPYFTTSETAKKFWVVDGKRYGIPFTWGTMTCDYVPDKTDPPESWLDLLKPKFKGKVGWVPEMVSAFTLGGRILGYDAPNYTQQQFQEVAKLLRRFRAQTRGFAPTYGDLTNQFAAGDVIASFVGWAALAGFAKGKNVTIKSVVPSEGSISFVDSYAIPPTADNRETVLAWINEALSPEIQAASAESLVGGVVVPAAVPKLSPMVKSLYPDAYDDMEAHFKNVPPYPYPPIEKSGGIVTRDEWAKEWSAVQAGH